MLRLFVSFVTCLSLNELPARMVFPSYLKKPQFVRWNPLFKQNSVFPFIQLFRIRYVSRSDAGHGYLSGLSLGVELGEAPVFCRGLEDWRAGLPGACLLSAIWGDWLTLLLPMCGPYS